MVDIYSPKCLEDFTQNLCECRTKANDTLKFILHIGWWAFDLIGTIRERRLS